MSIETRHVAIPAVAAASGRRAHSESAELPFHGLAQLLVAEVLGYLGTRVVSERDARVGPRYPGSIVSSTVGQRRVMSCEAHVGLWQVLSVSLSRSTPCPLSTNPQTLLPTRVFVL
eukprot:1930252-Rhodomonas_salina.4